MALSGTVNGSVTLNSKYLSFYFTWSAVQNIEGNYSDVTVKTYWKTNNTLWNFDTVAARPASITINGITQSISKVFAIYWSSVGNPYLIQTATQRVYHNADGTKSITISARANGTASTYGPSSNISSSGDCTASATVTLNTIPRASGISATNADIGSVSIITVNRYSTTFDHKITYSGTGISETTIVNNNEQSTISWTVPTSIFAKIPNSKYINLTIKCYTYSKSNNSLIGTSTTTMRATASEADCAPTVSGTVVDVNQKTISLTGNSNKLIRYRSTARCTISASAKNSATIVSRTVNGQSISSGNSVDIANVEVSQFVFKTVDSRGYSATKTINLSMVDYVPLTISPIFTREAPTSATIFVTFTGNYFNGSFGTANNTLTIKTRYKESGTDTWTNYSTVDASNIQLTSGNSYKSRSNITVGTDCNYQKSYDVQIVATDGTSTITLSTVTVTSSVSRGIPVFDWGNDGFNVNGDFTINNSPFFPISITNGGTGGQTAAQARENLNVAAIGDPVSLIRVYTSNSAKDESAFNQALTNFLKSMPDYSCQFVQWTCYPAVTGYSVIGILYKVDATYGALFSFSYGTELYLKRLLNGEWLNTITLA